MVFVDFSNPFLRGFFPRWLREHRARLIGIAKSLPGWAAGDPGENALPLAITLDIDEVLLCNIHLNAFPSAGFYVADHFSNPDDGTTWGRTDARDPPLPGARELIAAAHAAGVTVFLVTGRLEKIRDITVADLTRAGLDKGVGGDVSTRLRMLPEEPTGSVAPHKASLREAIAKNNRVLANVGDQASDLGDHSERDILLSHPFYFTK